MKTLDTGKYRYQFVGGILNGKIYHYAALIEARNLINGYRENNSARRAKGTLCAREELDNQPIVDGYLPPIYDGERWLVGGKMKGRWQCTNEEMANSEKIHIIRYETQEVYDMMSD